MKTENFLFEILCEELPPKGLKTLSHAFEKFIVTALKDARLKYHVIKSFATPRRLAILIEKLEEKQADQTIERKGPATNAAFDAAGNPTKACEGFAKSCDMKVASLERIQTDKGEFLFAKKSVSGKTIFELMPEMIERALYALPIKKYMRWGNYDFSFIRPVHNILMLYGDKIVPAKLFNLESTNTTLGHRFHFAGKLQISSPEEYEEILHDTGYVMADFEKRSLFIRKHVEACAKKSGGTAIIPEDLLSEVTAAVEWPVVLLAKFSDDYLTVPKEALMSSIIQHQKCFPIHDKEGNLLPKFLTVSNIESYDKKQIVEGNERVMNARLSDAKFFYCTDLKEPLASRTESIKKVIFEKELGSLWDKTERLMQLSSYIAAKINAVTEMSERAAFLSKTDLLTTMVGEFPELQGIMGYYYAVHDKELESVAVALKEQYLPRFAEDELPQNTIGQVLALADRIDTLIGIFGINKIPTGDKDPYALRRAAFGIIKIIIERQLTLDLKDLLEFAKKQYIVPLKNEQVIDQVLTFSEERLKSFVLDQGFTVNQFNAVQSKQIFDYTDFYYRLQAIKAFTELPEAEALAAANKRVVNLLNKEKIETIQKAVDEVLLTEKAEKALHALIVKKTKETEALLKEKSYSKILETLATTREPIDQFFDTVMVIVEDSAIRNNRLILLERLRDLFLQVADISLL